MKKIEFMKKIEILEQKLDNLENTIRFLLKHNKDEIVVEHTDVYVSWEYILGCRVIKLYLPRYYWEPKMTEYKRFNENQIIYRMKTDVDDRYYLLDKVRQEVIEIPNLIEEKPKTKKVRKVKDENKTEKPTTKRTKTTKRNKL